MTILNIFTPDWFDLMFRFGINIFFNGLIIAIVLALKKHRESYIFTFILVGIVIFFLCFTLKRFDLNLGLALGLFAIFGIIRYRTEALKPNEMTYLFVTIGVSLINSLYNNQVSLIEILTINFLIVLAVFICEKFFLKTRTTSISKEGLQVGSEQETNKLSLMLPYDATQNSKTIETHIGDIEKSFSVKVQYYKIFRVDFTTQMYQVNLFYTHNI